MNTHIIRLPKGDEDYAIDRDKFKWTVPDGTYVVKDQVIAEIDMDKAFVELNAPESGFLRISETVKEYTTDSILGYVNTK